MATTATPTPPADVPQQPDGSSAPSPALAPPPGNPRFPLFDGLRGIAVLAILSFHSWELSASLGIGVIGRAAEVAGGVAVIQFFVISGFLLYRPYVAARATGRHGPPVGRYARRRALRILPAYWLVLTVLAIVPGIAGVFTGSWWRFYGYLQLYGNQTRGQGIPVAWTLCVEVSFYIVLPIWALMMRRLRMRPGTGGLLRAEFVPLGLVVAFGLIVQLAVARGHLPYVLGVSLLGQISWIALGMLLAVASVAAQHDGGALRPLRWMAERPFLCWSITIAAFAGLMALVPSGGVFGLIATVERSQSLVRTAAKLALEALVVVPFTLPAIFGDQRRGAPRRLLAWRPVVYLGVISYSFYLWHLTIIQLLAVDRTNAFSDKGLGLMAHVHVARPWVLYFLSLAVTCVLASLSYRFVELPFLRRKEK